MSESDSMVVRSSVVVEVPIGRAFAVFTGDMANWWPPEHHLLEGELAEMVLEPRVGGHVFDRGTDGSECHWARVLAYDPPTRLVISWDINLQWQVEPDPEKASEVEVSFIAETPERTRVELEHRHLGRHGDGWEQMHGAVGSPDGWDAGLEAFARRVALVGRGTSS
ncbi:MAG TPA: SRPBCC family protein [Acidimicrobiales bacterium]|nr:SRPBCC family protein [Acidimicrobiales bacterium]